MKNTCWSLFGASQRIFSLSTLFKIVSISSSFALPDLSNIPMFFPPSRASTIIRDEPAFSSSFIALILSSSDISLSKIGSFFPTSDKTSNPSSQASSMHSNLSSWDMMVDPSDISIAGKPNSCASLKNSLSLPFLYASSNNVPPVYGVIWWDLYISTFALIISCSCTMDVPHPNFR